MFRRTTSTEPSPKQSPTAPLAVASDEPLFQLLSSQTLKLSKADAIKAAHAHANLPHSPCERPLDKHRLARLIACINENVWLPCDWATVQYEGVKYRMNGQHSSQAMIQAADDLPETVSVHLDHYNASRPGQMSALFRQFDNAQSARSKLDVSGAYQGMVPRLCELNRKNAKLGIDGIRWVEKLQKRPTGQGDDAYSMFFLEMYHPFLRWLDGLLSVKTPELKLAPIVGAMYETYDNSESVAEEFWRRVALADVGDDGDPRAVLSRDLCEAKEGRKGGVKDRMQAVEYFAKSVLAWNAFRGGKRITSLRWSANKGIPEVAE